ncbi:MAG: hypothetical protein ACYDCF_08455 [Burkholderiales bacterium]
MISSTLSPYGLGPHRQMIQIACFDVTHGEIIPNCAVTLKWFVPQTAGGHDHVVPIQRPPGQFTIGSQSAGYASTAVFTDAQGYGHWVCAAPTDPNAATPTLKANTGPSGVLDTVYTAPETAGATVVTLVGTAPTSTGSVTIGPTTFDIPVIAAEGLTFPSIPGLYITRQSQNHDHHNGYASAAMVLQLQAMMAYYDAFIANYKAVYGVSLPPPTIDAISLPEGGLFDYDHGNWCPPHVSHRFGNEVDIIPEGGGLATTALATAERRTGFLTPVWAESPANPHCQPLAYVPCEQ